VKICSVFRPDYRRQEAIKNEKLENLSVTQEPA
jgi:hypothetical protein